MFVDYSCLGRGSSIKKMEETTKEVLDADPVFQVLSINKPNHETIMTDEQRIGS